MTAFDGQHGVIPEVSSWKQFRQCFRHSHHLHCTPTHLGSGHDSDGLNVLCETRWEWHLHASSDRQLRCVTVGGVFLFIPIGRWYSLTSSDWRMVLSGIHAVPIKVSQMSPLLHTSTTRPRSRRLISLGPQIAIQK